MELDPTLLTAALFAPFLLDAVKYLYRRFVAKDNTYDFPKRFYELAVPFSVLIAQIVVGFVGWAPMPDVSAGFVLQWFLGIVIALLGYNMALKPLKDYEPNNF